MINNATGNNNNENRGIGFIANGIDSVVTGVDTVATTVVTTDAFGKIVGTADAAALGFAEGNWSGLEVVPVE